MGRGMVVLGYGSSRAYAPELVGGNRNNHIMTGLQIEPPQLGLKMIKIEFKSYLLRCSNLLKSLPQDGIGHE